MDLRDQLQATLGAAYTLERELGGGMARVFVARETALDRKVVMKVLPPELAASVSTERFRREIMLAARLQHAHIVPLLAAGESGALPYFTMPFVEGESLRVRLARHGELPVAEAVRILREIASALAYAHEHGVVHRDIKPDNVLLSAGAAMVSDFGVAKALTESSTVAYGRATSAGLALGTPAYMAPEQASADPAIDHRADIYAFGVLAYEALTGQPPFTGRTPQGLLAAQLAEPPEPITSRRANIPSALAALVMHCLEKRPADRPQTAGEIVHILDDVKTPSGGMQPQDATGASGARAALTFGRRDVLIGLAAVVLVGATATAILLRDRTTPTASDRSGANASLARDAREIAVIPFVNVGGDANEYFADGLTDELADALARLPGVRVAARSSAYSFKGKNVDASDVGRTLHVGSLVQGSVRHAPGRVRVTAALVNASDGLTLWSRSYDKGLRDVLALQNEIAQAIAGALNVTLGGGARALVTVGTESVEAHDLYLQGNFHLQRYTESDIRKSLALFARAIGTDSTYAAPWAGTARAWINLADDWLPPRDAYPKARQAARRALALDSTSADAHARLALIEMGYQWNFAAAERELRRALALEPRSIEARGWLADVLWRRGMRDSALALARSAVEVDPASLDAPRGLAYRLIRAKQLDSAEAWLDRARELDPQHSRLPGDFAQLRMAQGRWADALRELEASSAFVPLPLSQRAVCEARLGRSANARRLLATLEAERSKRYVAADLVANGYAALGDRDAAFRWLDLAFAERSSGLINLTDPNWDPIRDDPRFRALQRRIESSRGTP
ncbi:MAG TPA: protein kinase [Gemmatimonadaceae bacterium]|nr:protein kinase [Gemmatimonadaceae bacterium]